MPNNYSRPPEIVASPSERDAFDVAALDVIAVTPPAELRTVTQLIHHKHKTAESRLLRSDRSYRLCERGLGKEIDSIRNRHETAARSNSNLMLIKLDHGRIPSDDLVAKMEGHHIMSGLPDVFLGINTPKNDCLFDHAVAVNKSQRKLESLEPDIKFADAIDARRHELGRRGRVAHWLTGVALTAGLMYGGMQVTDHPESSFGSIETEQAIEEDPSQKISKIALLGSLGFSGLGITAATVKFSGDHYARRRARRLLSS